MDESTLLTQIMDPIVDGQYIMSLVIKIPLLEKAIRELALQVNERSTTTIFADGEITPIEKRSLPQ